MQVKVNFGSGSYRRIPVSHFTQQHKVDIWNCSSMSRNSIVIKLSSLKDSDRKRVTSWLAEAAPIAEDPASDKPLNCGSNHEAQSPGNN